GRGGARERLGPGTALERGREGGAERRRRGVWERGGVVLDGGWRAVRPPMEANRIDRVDDAERARRQLHRREALRHVAAAGHGHEAEIEALHRPRGDDDLGLVADEIAGERAETEMME